MVFSVVTLHTDVVGYQCFGGLCCLHLHFTLKMEAARSSEMLVFYHIITQHHNSEDHNTNFHHHENFKSPTWSRVH